MVVPKASDHISLVTSKYDEGNIIITVPLCLYKLEYLFPLHGSINDVLRYYNLSPVHIYPNGWTILSSFQNLLGILNEEPMVRVFKQYYTLISSTENGL